MTDGTGALICSQHPVNQSSGTVATAHTNPEGRYSSYEYACGSDVVATPGEKVCGGSIAGLSDDVAFTVTAAGLRVSRGVEGESGYAESPRYGLPSNHALGGCCLGRIGLEGCSRKSGALLVR